MRKDPTEFRQRFALWKNGEKPYENGLPKYLDGKDLQWDTFNYKIPYIPEKSIKLTNAGLATGARISTNMLDSLANTAEEIGLPIQTAIGLATKESTLGNPTDDRSMRTLLSAKHREDLEHELWKRGIRGNDQYGLHLVPDNAKTFYWDQLSLINYYNGERHLPDVFDRKENVNNLPSTLKKGLLFYKDHPDRYNPGQKNYQRLVDKRGAEVMLSPEVYKWLKERNIKKATGRFNRINPLLNESKFNLPKYEDGKNDMSWFDSAKDFVWSAAKFVDPFGILSYGDAYDAWKKVDENEPLSYANAAIETVGALPFIGKIGKAVNLIKKGSTVAKIAKKQKNITKTIRGVKLAGDTDRMVTGGSIEKSIAKKVADKSGGNADITALLGFIEEYPYNGYVNPSKGYTFEKSGNKDANSVAFFGNTEKYKKYTKPLRYNGKIINNAVRDLLFPIDNIRLPKELRPLIEENSGRIIGGNSENWLKDININKDILDSKNFSIGITPDTLRAFDVFDWQDNTVLGRMMNHAAKPSWAYPSKNTFVLELPITYTQAGLLNDWTILKSAIKNVDRSKTFLNKADSILLASGYKY